MYVLRLPLIVQTSTNLSDIIVVYIEVGCVGWAGDLWDVGCLDFGDGLPVHSGEPRMVPEVLDAVLTQPDLSRTNQTLHQILSLVRNLNVCNRAGVITKQFNLVYAFSQARPCHCATSVFCIFGNTAFICILQFLEF